MEKATNKLKIIAKIYARQMGVGDKSLPGRNRSICKFSVSMAEASRAWPLHILAPSFPPVLPRVCSAMPFLCRKKPQSIRSDVSQILHGARLRTSSCSRDWRAANAPQNRWPPAAPLTLLCSGLNPFSHSPLKNQVRLPRAVTPTLTRFSLSFFC